MRYISTRGQCDPVHFSEAVAIGLATDGGLFLPESLPSLQSRLREWERLSYAELAFAFFELFADDLKPERLAEMTNTAYATFSDPAIAPLKQLREDCYVLELFHGPTLAFKDFALQWLGNLYEEQIRRSGKTITVLGATSGDTGAAAIHGLLGKEGVRIFILYPNGRISPLQERQMTCTGAENVFPIAIDGSFDDAQRLVKATFADQEFRLKHHLSAINSINLARILAQCVYYIYGWLQLPQAKRDKVECVVPTGNFGNILAGWLAQKMGLPLKSLKVATNQNDILYRLFTTGNYSIDTVAPSLAPSMDIQVASNFERFLYYAEDRDAERVRNIMQTFGETGRYNFQDFDPDTFTASRTNDTEIPDIIERIYRETRYVLDPHTACGFKDHDPDATTLVMATAHPAKFPTTIQQAIGIEPKADSLEALKDRERVRHRLGVDLKQLKQFIVEHV